MNSNETKQDQVKVAHYQKVVKALSNENGGLRTENISLSINLQESQQREKLKDELIEKQKEQIETLEQALNKTEEMLNNLTEDDSETVEPEEPEDE